MEAIIDRPSEVLYNRAKGTLDISLPLSTPGDEMEKFVLCMRGAMSEVKNRCASLPIRQMRINVFQ